MTLYGLNIDSPEQLAMLTAMLRAAGAEPVIAIDEEGGDVTRIAHRRGSPYPGNAALGAIDDAGLTEAVYAALGADLAALGISLDLAPAVDVNTAADNPVIGTRSFGSDTALVARHAAAAVTGLQSAGVAACAKHFPGHGSTQLDSHQELATVDASLSLLAERDLPPFVAAIAAGVRAIMPGHLRVPELTGDLPASLSPAALTGLLRGELGFTGVIVSDGLEMRAVGRRVRDPGGGGTGRAGWHRPAVPGPRSGPAHVRAGPRGRWWTPCGPAGCRRAAGGGRGPGRRLRDWTAAAGRAASATGARRSAWPPRAVRSGWTACRSRCTGRSWSRWSRPPTWPPGRCPGAWAPGCRPTACAGSARAPRPAAWPARSSALLAEAAGRSLVIVVRDAHRHPAAASIASAILAARPDAVVVEMGLPVWRPPAGLYLATFGAARTSSRAAAEVLGLAAPGR